jgi:hypothetical protein
MRASFPYRLVFLSILWQERRSLEEWTLSSVTGREDGGGGAGHWWEGYWGWAVLYGVFFCSFIGVSIFALFSVVVFVIPTGMESCKVFV